MKKRILSIECLEKIGQEVLLRGWVQTTRTHGKIAFFDLRDRTSLIQIVATGSHLVKQITELGQQDVVEVVGVVKQRADQYKNPNLKTGEVEVEASNIIIIAKAAEMPFDMAGKDLNLELPTLLDNRSLTLRHSKIRPIFEIQSALLEGFRKAATTLGCVEIVVPTIVSSATEGGTELFPVEYYKYKAYLAQSPQLYKQMMVPIFERVFTIAHAYRAEPSVTTRHLSETTQMDCEIGFVDFTELLDMFEGMAFSMLKYTQEQLKEVFSENNLVKILFGKVPRLRLQEAQEIIFKEFGRDNRKEKDLAPQDELDICAWSREKHKSDFVTITHFPTKAKPFYTMPDKDDPEYSLSYDLLFRGVEIMSGSQRINDYDQLTASIKNRGMDPSYFELYLQAFKYGMPEEGGFSFGLERITMKVMGLGNVREASLFPRDMERIDEKLTSS